MPTFWREDCEAEIEAFAMINNVEFRICARRIAIDYARKFGVRTRAGIDRIRTVEFDEKASGLTMRGTDAAYALVDAADIINRAGLSQSEKHALIKAIRDQRCTPLEQAHLSNARHKIRKEGSR
ncbi:MAG TPA: hypothetical protein VI958_10700 [Acidobacteriota bacterium]